MTGGTPETVTDSIAKFAVDWADIESVVVRGDGLGPVRDQGQRGTCLAFATSAAHGAARAEPDALSAEWLYWAAKRRDSDPDDGTTPYAIRDALLHEGQPEDRVWPYDEARSHSDPGYAPPPLNGEVCYRRATTGTRPTVADVTAALDAGATPVLGITLTSGFPLATGTGGRVGALAARAAIIGAHAVLAVGYGRDRRDGEEFVLIRNSWGHAWGKSGYALVASEYLRLHLRSAFSLS
jgi:hypothetical protein